MSVYDSKELMSFKSAAREYNVPVETLQLSASKGALRVIELEGVKLLWRPDIEQLVKRTVKRGEGNKVVTRLK
ncbi:MAG: hypothetical protein L0220_19515 [Acidobacteria bacterium]|nr:hypothetical protein [Acidobacteriota bacterium]